MAEETLCKTCKNKIDVTLCRDGDSMRVLVCQIVPVKNIVNYNISECSEYKVIPE